MNDGQRRRFGPFEIDPPEERLWRDGVAVPVTRRAYAVLVALVERAGRLVTKKELFAGVWSGAGVSDAALSRCIRELRVALGDDAATPRYIETAHGRGFRFIAEVTPAAPAKAAGFAAPPRRTTSIVGRSAPLRHLGEALDAARAGRRRVVFVTGEAGIGKTALVEAFLAGEARTEGSWIAQGRCVEQYGAGEAYLPIIEALEQLSRAAGPDHLRAVLERYAPAWLPLLPWLAHDSAAEARARASSGVTAQRLLREIVHALEVLSADQPIVLWLEDLHWSDPSSLDVLSFLAGRGGEARLLVVASYRPAELAAPESPLRALKQQLQLRGQCEEIALGLLGRADITGYLATRFAAAEDATLADLAGLLHRRTEGNPLFLVTVVDDLVRRGDIDAADAARRAAQPVADLGAAIPESLRELVEGQFDRLPAAERAALEAAAVAGTEFSAAAVAAGLDIDVAAAEDDCSHLAQQGRFLAARAPATWPDGTHAAGFRFRHALYRQAIYERVPAGRRSEMHRRIGVREEEAYGDKVGTVAAELAIHFEAARDVPRALRHLAQAGHNALARHAYAEAGALLARALALLEGADADARERRELALLLPLGAAQMAAQGYGAAAAAETYARAVSIARAIGDHKALGRALKGAWNVALVRAELDGALALADELLDHAGADPGLDFDAHAKLGQTFMHRGELAASRRHLERALSLVGAPDTRRQPNEAPRVAAYLAWVLWFQGHPDSALARGREALDRAAVIGNPHSSAFAFGFVAWLHEFRGEHERMRALAVEQQSLAGEHGLGYWLTWSRFTLGLAATLQGESAPGLREMRDALAAYRDTGAEVGVPHFLCILADAHLRARQVEPARAVIAEAAALIARNGNRYPEAEVLRLGGEIAARAAHAAADPGAADEACARAIAVAEAQGNRAYMLRALAARCRLRPRGRPIAPLRAQLAAALDAFDEGEETRDLREARNVLAAVPAGPR